jgi:pilus assembly protein Flp/PilA
MKRLRALLKDTKGAPAIEYALVASLIAVAAVVSFRSLGDNLNNSYGNVAETISTKP